MPAKPQPTGAKQNLPAAPTSLLSTSAAPQIATAARVFAQAIHRAVISEDSRPSRAADPLALAVATTDLAPHAVTASGDAQHAALDMSQRDWPGAMIARIETLREAAADAANAADTRIRLVPDALGTIDVSLRTEGETVHVHFAAEQAQTRALLADAHARLTELADARGLKLSQSGVDGGGGQPPRPPQPTRATPDAPRSVEPIDDTADYRIA